MAIEKSDYARLFAAAVVQVVEDARWERRIKSIRELSRLAGWTHHTALNDRIRKGKPFDVRDLAQLAPVLGLTVREIVERAERIVGPPPGLSQPDEQGPPAAASG